MYICRYIYTYGTQTTMISEHQTTLYKRYPLIFAHRPDIACGDGWFDLLDVLCASLQKQTDDYNAPQAVLSQAKEKFGQLRFYTHAASAEQRGMIWLTEAMSGRICDQCGRPGALLVAGAVMTRCSEHAPADAMPRDEFMRKQVGRK